MKCVFEKVLVALRKPDDILPVINFLKEKNEKPRLVLLNLIPMKFVQESVVSFRTPSKDDLGKFENISGFDFEVAKLQYDASEFPAIVVSKEAQKRKCDVIIAVSSGNKGMFATDFASSIALESDIPVMVLRN
jgi:hypothetical protein